MTDPFRHFILDTLIKDTNLNEHKIFVLNARVHNGDLKIQDIFVNDDKILCLVEIDLFYAREPVSIKSYDKEVTYADAPAYIQSERAEDLNWSIKITTPDKKSKEWNDSIFNLDKIDEIKKTLTALLVENHNE